MEDQAEEMPTLALALAKRCDMLSINAAQLLSRGFSLGGSSDQFS